MTDHKIDIPQFLKAHGLSLTTQRTIILDELDKSKKHLSAHEIYDRVRKIMPRISFGTVYRNLNMLVDLDLVLKQNFWGKEALYEIYKNPHYHIICTECGKMDDLKGVRIDQVEVEMEKLTNYRIHDHQMEVFGICPGCRTKEVQIVGE